MAEVRFEQATRIYPGTDAPALDALDLDIADGELMVLVGPSGSGKTTALRMLAGLEEVDAGAVYIGERDVSDDPPKKRDVAMVFQNYALYPYLTVADNMGFPLRVTKVPKGKREERVREVAEMLELTPYLQRKPGQLSGGQRQRVAMGRAIVRQPQVYLMDEPLSNLDAQLRVQMRADIASLQGAPRRHDRLRHPRSGRGDDARASRGRAARSDAAAVRHAAGAVRPPRQHVRRRLRRLARDEPRHAPACTDGKVAFGTVTLDAVNGRERLIIGVRPEALDSRTRGWTPASTPSKSSASTRTCSARRSCPAGRRGSWPGSTRGTRPPAASGCACGRARTTSPTCSRQTPANDCEPTRDPAAAARPQ